MRSGLLLWWGMVVLAPVAAGAHAGEASDPAAMPVATAMPAATPMASPDQVPAAAAAADPAADEAAVKAVVADFHRALVEGYREGVLKLVDARAVIFETGYVEVDRDQYATGHLDSDLMFAAQVKRDVVHSVATVAGDMAVVLTQSRNAGEFMGATLNLENTETMVLRRGADGWKIVHIHWSGHERAPDAPAASETAPTPEAQ